MSKLSSIENHEETLQYWETDSLQKNKMKERKTSKTSKKNKEHFGNGNR